MKSLLICDSEKTKFRLGSYLKFIDCSGTPRRERSNFVFCDKDMLGDGDCKIGLSKCQTITIKCHFVNLLEIDLVHENDKFNRKLLYKYRENISIYFKVIVEGNVVQ